MMNDDYLIHYGVLGMKWGIRKKKISKQTKIKESRNKLSQYDSYELTNKTLNKYKKQYNNLKHVRIDKNTKGKMYTENGKVIAMVNTERKSDGNIWIQGLEVFGKGKGSGLSKGLLDVAVKDLGATHLSVRRTNTIAKKIYDDYGFKTYDSDDYMDYMRINKKN